MRKSVPILVVSFALVLLLSSIPLGDQAWNALSTPAKKASPGDKLLAAQAELASTRDNLVATQGGMAAIGDKLLATQAELASTRDNLVAAQTELSSVKQALARATAQVRYRDPTYSEVIQFLREDQTDRRSYDLDAYNCRDFSADVINNAEAQGIRTAYVSIRLRQGSHAVVAFDTVDRGLVYFEPQTDKEVLLPLGQSYLKANGYKPQQGQDDTITRTTVIW